MSEILCSDKPLTLNFTADVSELGATVSFFVGPVCPLSSAAFLLLLANEKVMAMMLIIKTRKMSFVLSREQENSAITNKS